MRRLTSRSGFSEGWLLVIITVVAAVVRLAAAGFVYGVVVGDVTDYVAVGQMVLRGDNVYVRGYPYPPPWMFVSALGVLLSQSLKIPFDFLIKLPLIMTDVLIAVLLFKAAQAVFHPGRAGNDPGPRQCFLVARIGQEAFRVGGVCGEVVRTGLGFDPLLERGQQSVSVELRSTKRKPGV